MNFVPFVFQAHFDKIGDGRLVVDDQDLCFRLQQDLFLSRPVQGAVFSVEKEKYPVKTGGCKLLAPVPRLDKRLQMW